MVRRIGRSQTTHHHVIHPETAVSKMLTDNISKLIWQSKISKSVEMDIKSEGITRWIDSVVRDLEDFP